MKKLVSLVLVLMLVLPMLPVGLAEEDFLPMEEPAEAGIPVPTQEPDPVPTQEPDPVPTQEPDPEPTQEPDPEPTQEPDPEPTQEPVQEPTAEPEALPAPANLHWDEEGNIFFEMVAPAADEYRVVVYRDGQSAKELLFRRAPGDTPTLTVQAGQVLGDPGEYVFEVVALAIDGWLDSEAVKSPPFQYQPSFDEDPYADMDPISALAARVEAGEMTALEARNAILSMSAQEIADLLRDNQAAVDALSMLEALYMQAEGIGLGVNVADEIQGAELSGISLNAWDSPQELRMRITAAINEDASLGLSFALEAVQPEPTPPEAHHGQAIVPVYVTVPVPDGFSSEEASLTNANGENIVFKVKDNQISFVLASFGKYQITHWAIPVENMPVITMPLGAFIIVSEELEELEANEDEPLPREGNIVGTERLLELLNAPPVAGEEWIVENTGVAVSYPNGILAAVNEGETLVTRMSADGEEQQVIVRVTPIDGLSIKTPYNRVLPSGSVEFSVPLKITPAYGLSKLSAVRTSDYNTMNRADVSFGIAGAAATATVNPLLVTVIQRSLISGRVYERIDIRNATTSQVMWQAPVQKYSKNAYTMTAVIPPFANGKYSMVFFAYPGMEPENSNNDVYDFTIDFYIENGKAYLTHEYSDSCNSGVLSMLNAGNVPDDISALLALGIDPAYTAASDLIQGQARTLAATSGTQYGKAMAIYKWIAENIAFDYDALYNNTYHGNPYITYIARRGTSSGYATLASLMLHYAGIKSVSVVGYGGPKVGVSVQNHQWNAVLIDKVWHFFDVTWDAIYSYENVTRIKTGSNTYKYFLPTTQFISYDHRATGLGASSGGTGVTSKLKDLAPIEAFVTRLYVNVLGRKPDTEGFINWRNGLANGVITGAQACVGFYTSPEFFARNLTDAQFLDNLYRTCLNRKPAVDPGFSDWEKTLAAGATRNSVMNGFIISPEFNKICQNYGIVRGVYNPTDYRDKNMLVTMFVVRLYRNFLARDPYDPVWPDTQGLEDWCRGLLAVGLTGNQVALGFYTSPEFQKRMDPGDPMYLTDIEFVRTMYRTLLDREPDPKGLSDWLDAVSKYGRKRVYDGFIASAEWKKLMGIYGIK